MDVNTAFLTGASTEPCYNGKNWSSSTSSWHNNNVTAKRKTIEESAAVKVMRRINTNEEISAYNPLRYASSEHCSAPRIAGDSWSQINLPCELPIHVQSNISNFEVNLQSDYDITDDFLGFTLSTFKQETSSPPNNGENSIIQHCQSEENPPVNYSIDHIDQSPSHQKYSSLSKSPLGFYIDCNDKIIETEAVVQQQYQIEHDYGHVSPASTVTSGCPASPDSQDDHFRFQYVLCASTSFAMKVCEETLTYLNQSQPYEIKLKKLGDLTSSKGKVFKSIVRVLFHDRRLQYMEREQMSNWQLSRPGDRLLEIDLPLSYGIYDHIEDANSINSVQFLWDPTKEVGVYIKVNCISTEFTAKKHGGEKGVSFRLQIETYLHDKNSSALHSASCQIKVFKLKGADRKHKQDREKILKKSPFEREHYQQSYECTVLSDMWPSSEIISSPTVSGSMDSPPISNVQDNDTLSSSGHISDGFKTAKNESNLQNECGSTRNVNIPESTSSPSSTARTVSLTKESSITDLQKWLNINRFGSYCQTFANFTAVDMFNLSRSDLIHICGFPDGIRLFNTLPILPKLTLYIEKERNSNVYYPIYLKSLTCQELISNIAPLVGLLPFHVHSAYVMGPHNINIIVTDTLVENMKEESLFFLKVVQENPDQQISKLFLKTITISSNDIPSSSNAQI